MESRLANAKRVFAGSGSVMDSHAEKSSNQSSENKSRGPRNGVINVSMLPVDALGIDSFNECFPSIADLNVGSIFVSNKKSSEVQNFVPASSPNVNRISGNSKGPSLVGGFGTDANSLSSFDLEYALLEQALRKDGSTSIASMPCALQTRPEKRNAPSLLEPEFYFSDILGDNGVPPQPLSIKVEDNDDEPSTFQTPTIGTGSRRIQEHEATQKRRNPSINASMDPELARALANLAGSDASGDVRNSESAPNSLKRYQMTFSNVTRDHENGAGHNHTRRASSSRNSSSTNATPFGLSDLQNLEALDRASTERKKSEIKHITVHGENTKNIGFSNSLIVTESNDRCHNTVHSPISDSSMTGTGIGTHPDLYENLRSDIREKVDSLRDKISAMPRRKLRESLAKGVSIDDVEPLMCINRDELAGMLGLGVTTWKMFVHHTLGIPRWPARALKSQRVKETKLLQKKLEAERRGEFEAAEKVTRELFRMTQAHMKRRKLFRNDKLKVSSTGIRKD